MMHTAWSAALLFGLVLGLGAAATGEDVNAAVPDPNDPHARFVAVDGTPQGKGTMESPWDIASALGGKQKVEPGTTIWIRGGAYINPNRDSGNGFALKLTGAEDKPIHVRGWPGERVTLDGGLGVHPPTDYVWVRDLEIIVAENLTQTRISKERGSHPKDLNRPWGSLNILTGKHCKYINLVLHHNAQGVGFWRHAGSELYGCLVYDNGWIGPDRYHGPGIYTQNVGDPKFIADNIIAGNYSTTIQAYGSKNTYVDHYRFEGNICYDPVKEGRRARFLVGGGRPSQDIVVQKNYLYEVPMQIGYSAPHNEDCIVRDNVIVNAGLSITRYRKAVNENNLVIGVKQPRPEGALVVLRPNRYDPDRAHLAIFNWQKAKGVRVEAGDFMKDGDEHCLLDPKDFFGAPLARGACAAGGFEIAMDGEFAAFVVLRKSDITASRWQMPTAGEKVTVERAAAAQRRRVQLKMNLALNLRRDDPAKAEAMLREVIAALPEDDADGLRQRAQAALEKLREGK